MRTPGKMPWGRSSGRYFSAPTTNESHVRLTGGSQDTRRVLPPEHREPHPQGLARLNRRMSGTETSQEPSAEAYRHILQDRTVSCLAGCRMSPAVQRQNGRAAPGPMDVIVHMWRKGTQPSPAGLANTCQTGGSLPPMLAIAVCVLSPTAACCDIAPFAPDRPCPSRSLAISHPVHPSAYQ